MIIQRSSVGQLSCGEATFNEKDNISTNAGGGKLIKKAQTGTEMAAKKVSKSGKCAWAKK